MAKNNKLTWRDLFDSTKCSVYKIDDMLELLQTTGYKLFCWNGWIYGASDDYTAYYDTGLKIEIL
jgi:hypothetical protein